MRGGYVGGGRRRVRWMPGRERGAAGHTVGMKSKVTLRLLHGWLQEMDLLPRAARVAGWSLASPDSRLWRGRSASPLRGGTGLSAKARTRRVVASQRDSAARPVHVTTHRRNPTRNLCTSKRRSLPHRRPGQVPRCYPGKNGFWDVGGSRNFPRITRTGVVGLAGHACSVRWRMRRRDAGRGPGAVFGRGDHLSRFQSLSRSRRVFRGLD